MKGAILDWIRSMGGSAIQSRCDIVYTNPPSLTDLEANGLVTKTMLLAAVPPFAADPVTTAIVGGVTANPITVNYGDMQDPTLIFRNADGTNYSGAVNSIDHAYDGSPVNSITLTGDDDGAGHFADSFSFIIKP